MMQEAAPAVERDQDSVTVESTAVMNDVQSNDVVQEEAVTTASSSERDAEEVTSWSVQPCSVAFACLYTKHKTQKRKIWQDGRLVLGSSCLALLYDANPAPGAEASPLGECELTNSQRNALLQKHETRLEFEKYLVEMQGLWNGVEAKKVIPPSSFAPARSVGMQKVLTKRFQKPGAFVPPDPTRAPLPQQNHQRLPNSVLGKRQRPLQPGELQQKYYGNRAVPPPSAAVVASAWHQQVTPPPVIIQSTLRVRVSSSQQRTPFVTSDQMQDTEHWSPRRQSSVPSMDSGSHHPNHQHSRDERSTIPPKELPHSMPCFDSHQPSSMEGDHSYPTTRNEVNTVQPPENEPPRPRNQFRDKNGFDPNNFFGEEEEEEVDSEDDEHEIGSNREKPCLPVHVQPNATHNQRGSWDSTNLSTGKSQPNRVLESSCKEQDNSVLSRNELLQLFATSSPVKPTPLIPETAQCNTLSEKKSEDAAFELALPSASESSSDEESAC